MKFLIDECLHTSLVTVAHEAGYLCDHVNFMGLSGWTDRRLMGRIRRDEYTFVTNNLTDFAALFSREEIHRASLSLSRMSPLLDSGISSVSR